MPLRRWIPLAMAIYLLPPGCQRDAPAQPPTPSAGPIGEWIAPVLATLQLHAWGLRPGPIVHITRDHVWFRGRAIADTDPARAPTDPSDIEGLLEAVKAVETLDGKRSDKPAIILVDPEVATRAVIDVASTLSLAGYWDSVIAVIYGDGAMHLLYQTPYCLCGTNFYYRIHPRDVFAGDGCDADAVRRVALYHLDEFRGCRNRTPPEGWVPTRLRLEWLIDTAGRPMLVTATTRDPVAPEVTACWKSMAEQWRFPPPAGGSCQVTHDFDLEERPPPQPDLQPPDPEQQWGGRELAVEVTGARLVLAADPDKSNFHPLRGQLNPVADAEAHRERIKALRTWPRAPRSAWLPIIGAYRPADLHPRLLADKAPAPRDLSITLWAAADVPAAITFELAALVSHQRAPQRPVTEGTAPDDSTEAPALLTPETALWIEPLFPQVNLFTF